MFNKVLIANRGLIAANCVRAVKELGARAIVIYEKADKISAAVRNADEAYEIFPTEDHVRPYMNVDQIVELASKLEVDAVHPGYGFLSQNVQFAEALSEKGIALIAPKAEGVFNVANKHIVKAYAAKSGLPILPGSESFTEKEWLHRFADAIQYPLVVKSVYGYGGIGMKVVRNESELVNAYDEVQHLCDRHLMNAPDVYLEKYLEGAHHVEFPVLRDANGHTIVFPEQENSAQRRFQKLLVETPSPNISPSLRKSLESEIRVLVDRLDIFGFTSVEFLVKDGKAYFLEINGYIQPSHSATSILTGVDLLKEQVRLLSGENLSFTNDDLLHTGHVICSYIFAEDPENNFAPSPGTIDRLYLPFGEGVSVQMGIFSGAVVSPYYDPMVGKLLVRGMDRAEAIQKMNVALGEFFIEGVKSNISLMRSLINSEAFADAVITYDILRDAEQRKMLVEAIKTDEAYEVASLVAALALHREPERQAMLDDANKEDDADLGASSRWIQKQSESDTRPPLNS